MHSRIFLSVIMLFLVFQVNAQRATLYGTSSGQISFFSDAPEEDIEAKSNLVKAGLNDSTGQLAFSMDIISFTFSNPTMQTHFNENYMESETYPKSVFDGKITNNGDVKYTTDGTYDVSVSGKLTIHGVTKDVTVTGKLIVKGSIVTASCVFNISLADYNIVNDKTDNIANTIKITVVCSMAKK